MPFSIPALATQCLANNVFRGQNSDGAGLLELVLLQVLRCGQDEGVMVLLRIDPLHLPIFLVYKQVIHCHHQIYRLRLLVHGAYDPLYAALVHWHTCNRRL